MMALKCKADFFLWFSTNKITGFWTHENPHITEIKELKSQKVAGIWCVLSATQIFALVFIQENITEDVYQSLFKSEFLLWCKKKKFIEDFWFLQDWAIPHRTKTSIFFVK